MTFSSEDRNGSLCWCNHVMGNGIVSDIQDIVVVPRDTFDRAKSRQAAEEVAQFNRELSDKELPYLLIGVGRWGASDPWLGIPVNWDEISGAKVIVEAGIAGFEVEPSQGSHFFQNLVAASVGYFSVEMGLIEGKVDWDWLDRQPAVQEKEFTRWIKLERPLEVRMAGQEGAGVILKSPSRDS